MKNSKVFHAISKREGNESCMKSDSKVVLITGANRGLGLAIGGTLDRNDYTVVKGVRNIKDSSDNQIYIDVSELDKIKPLIDKIIERYGHIDVLINNAGIYKDDPRKGFGDIFMLDHNLLEYTMKVNYLGPYELVHLILPYMISQGYGRIINISSGMGRLSEFDAYSYAYRSSKLLLNTITISFGKLFSNMSEDIAIASLCPGWIRTDMGTDNGPVESEIPAKYVLELLQKEKMEINGKFFRNGVQLDWSKK